MLRRGSMLLGLACVAAVAGCGGSDYKNADRPPAPINVTVALTDKRISVSPQHFGAGPIVIIISNQSSTKQTVTWQTQEIGGSKPGQKAASDPIGPRGTSTLEVDPPQGTYAIATRGGTIKPVTVHVSRQRQSAQDQLLQP